MASEKEELKRPEVIVGIIIGVLAAAYFIWSSGSVLPPSDRGEAAGAYSVIQQRVEALLKAPSTAKFAPLSDSTVTTEGNATFTISSYVDAQNSFGAMLRTRFTGKVQYLGNGKWKVLDISVVGM